MESTVPTSLVVVNRDPTVGTSNNLLGLAAGGNAVPIVCFARAQHLNII